MAQSDIPNTPTERAIFAGGCFWCTEAEFSQAEGVLSVTSGYIGGHVANPTYAQVTSKKTGHAEAVEVAYNPEIIAYTHLLDIYWSNIDPTDPNGQFYDRGDSYRTVIFTTTAEQKALAETSKAQVEAKLGTRIYTTIEPAPTFYPAESYHQDYYKKNPAAYEAYKKGSGREHTLQTIWGEKRSQPSQQTQD